MTSFLRDFFHKRKDLNEHRFLKCVQIIDDKPTFEGVHIHSCDLKIGYLQKPIKVTIDSGSQCCMILPEDLWEIAINDKGTTIYHPKTPPPGYPAPDESVTGDPLKNTRGKFITGFYRKRTLKLCAWTFTGSSEPLVGLSFFSKRGLGNCGVVLRYFQYANESTPTGDLCFASYEDHLRCKHCKH